MDIQSDKDLYAYLLGKEVLVCLSSHREIIRGTVEGFGENHILLKDNSGSLIAHFASSISHITIGNPDGPK